MSIPWNQTLVIKGVSMVKKEAITDALSRQGLLLERNNPKFDDDRYGQNLICYANYKSTTDCNEAEHKMQRWLNERKWDTSGVHVYVKANRFQCRIVCVCKDKFRETHDGYTRSCDPGGLIGELPVRLDVVVTDTDGHAATAAPPDVSESEQQIHHEKLDGHRDGWKTRLCEYYDKGNCKNTKKNCYFAHGLHDLQQYKTELCTHDQQGRCQQAQTCTFAHGESEIRRRCKLHFEFKDGCIRGEACHFSHDKNPASTMPEKRTQWNDEVLHESNSDADAQDEVEENLSMDFLTSSPGGCGGVSIMDYYNMHLTASEDQALEEEVRNNHSYR